MEKPLKKESYANKAIESNRSVINKLIIINHQVGGPVSGAAPISEGANEQTSGWFTKNRQTLH